jgi:hypothetical protein
VYPPGLVREVLDQRGVNGQQVRSFPAVPAVDYCVALILYPEPADAGVFAVFDELKTQLVQRRRTFRSKTPNGVRQEFYGWVLAHYAVCWLMHQAASAHRVRQRSLSFAGHVQLLRRA